MRRVALLALILTVLVAMTPASARSGTASAPRLTPGDTWVYKTNTSLGAGFFLEGYVTLAVIDHAPVSVEGTTTDAYRLSVSGAGTASGNFSTRSISSAATGSWMLTGEQVLESAGFKTIATVLDLRANGTLQTQPVPIPFELRVQNTSRYRVIQDEWHFPLEVGTSTVVRIQLNFTEDFRLFVGIPMTPIHSAGIIWSNVTYTLEAEVEVDTLAGHFGTFRIRQERLDGTYNLLFYAPTAGNDVRTESYNGTDPVASGELVSYRYQALEPARLFGLTASDWTVVVVLVVAAVATVFLATRWLRRTPPPRKGPPPSP